MGNREAKELICTTHGHELRSGVMGEGMRGAGQSFPPEIGTTVIA